MIPPTAANVNLLQSVVLPFIASLVSSSHHSCASIVKSKNMPLSVISEGMGHDNEETTRIYLAAIQTN